MRGLSPALVTGALLGGLVLAACGSSDKTDSAREAASTAAPATSAATVGETTPQAGDPGVCKALEQADVVDGTLLTRDSCYEVRSPLVVRGGVLAVEPGVRLEFAPDAHLSIAQGGGLHAVGTADEPVTFTSMDPNAGWRGIHLDGSRSTENALHHVTVEHGGSSSWTGATAQSTSALFLSGDASADIQFSSFVGSGGQGITLQAGSEVTFENNTLEDNVVAAWVHPGNAGDIDATTTFRGNADEVVRVGFGNGDRITAAQTWQALDVPYEIQDRFFVAAHLTVEPGAVLAAQADVSIIVDDDGALTAEGTAEAPITFTGAEALGGYWQGIQITTATADNVFDHVLFENGGSGAWTGRPDSIATVYLEGNSKAVITNSTFRGSDLYGLWVPADADIAGFAGNRFEGNARTMIVHPDRAGAIAADNTFVENTDDRVWMSFGNSDRLVTTQTWADFGTPFYVSTRTFVSGALSIAPGTEVEFAQDASLIVTDGGSLRADGTAEDQVVLRGGEDLVGYWQGVQYDTASAGNALTQVVLANGGSQPWTGGSDSTGTLHVTADGRVDLAAVTFQSTGGYAVVARGAFTCSSVDPGGAQYYLFVDGTGAARSEC